MKMKSILVSMLAVATLASCSKENDPAADVGADTGATKAFMSLSINMPSSSAVRAADAGPGTDPGVSAEQGVTKVTVVGFADNGDKVQGAIYNLTSADLGTIGVGGTPATKSPAFEVSGKVKKIFVVVNPTAETTTALNNVGSFSALLTTVINTEAVGALTVANNFMMTSENGLQAAAVVVAASSTPADIAAAKAAAEAAAAVVKVDRAVSKVKMTHGAITVKDGATASITGFMLNTTNKSYYPYSELVSYTTTSDPTLAKYRKDPNWMSADDGSFNWVRNPDVPATHTWSAKDASLYCLENTMDVSAQNDNNTTKMVIKATYTPAGITENSKSWFRLGGVIMTFEDLKATYAGYKAIIADAGASQENKEHALNNLKAFDGFAMEFGAASFDDLTFVALEITANGGYKAATISPYMIEYYQHSICYYDVNIKHDNAVPAFGLGRWGVVRNNFYTLNVESISKAGKPYIPDTTDTEITDPENPNPIDPTPNDDKDGYISVSITINPWYTWTQGVDL